MNTKSCDVKPKTGLSRDEYDVRCIMKFVVERILISNQLKEITSLKIIM